MSANNLSNNIYIVLDVGTSSLKCGSFTADKQSLCERVESITGDFAGERCEIDFDLYVAAAQKVLHDVVAETVAQGHHPTTILLTSQAQTFVPVDEKMNPLRKGLVWLDMRAQDQARSLQEQLPSFPHAAGFSAPSPALYLSKLLYLKEREPEIFERARFFPIIDQYIAYRLTGEFYAEYSNFGMSGAYNIQTQELYSEALDILGLSKENFPAVSAPCCRGVEVSDTLKREWGIEGACALYLCGNDQSASAAGAGVRSGDDISLNMGTALVFYTPLQSQIEEPTDNQIIGLSPFNGAYFLISLENEFGNIIDHVKKCYFPHGSYEDIFACYRSVDDAARVAVSIVNSRGETATEATAEVIAASVTHYFLEKIKEHLASIEREHPINHIFISGGVSQSKEFVALLKGACAYPIVQTNARQAGLTGAITLFEMNQ